MSISQVKELLKQQRSNCAEYLADNYSISETALLEMKKWAAEPSLEGLKEEQSGLEGWKEKFFNECTEWVKENGVHQFTVIGKQPHEIIDWIEANIITPLQQKPVWPSSFSDGALPPLQQTTLKECYVWVKASERLPANRGEYVIRKDGDLKIAYFTEQWGWEFIGNGKTAKDPFGYEWLEQVSLPIKEGIIEPASVVSLTSGAGNSIEQVAWEAWKQVYRINADGQEYDWDSILPEFENWWDKQNFKIDNLNLHLKIINLTQQLCKFALIDASIEKPTGDALLLTTSKVFIIGDWYDGAWRTFRSRWEDGKLVSAYEEKDITHWLPLPYHLLNSDKNDERTASQQQPNSSK